jgi:hypothetical protein
MVAGNAAADVGSGEVERGVDVLSATHARPMSEVGDDAIRFSTTPSLGGRAWIVEWRGDERGRGATGSITFLYWTRDGAPLNVGTVQIGLSKEEYSALATEVDRLMRSPEPKPQTCENGHCLIDVCTDGPGYLIERRHGGSTTWMSGDCGDHPNNRIAKLMLSSAWTDLCRYHPATSNCPPQRPR